MRHLTLALALAAFALAGSSTAADLTVKVDGIDKPGGTLKVQLMDSAEAWAGKAKPVGAARQVIDSTAAVELSFKNLPAGRYALRLMHDENDNGKLDSNLIGMPTEGYGYSNNPDLMRAARFEEAAFDLSDDGAAIEIKLR